MFVGTILKGKSLKGYIDKGLVEVDKIQSRHDELVKEMLKRNFKHNSELPSFISWREGEVNVVYNIRELSRRCPDCRCKINTLNEGNT